MELVVCAVFDEKVKAFHPPMFVRESSVCVRWAMSELANPSTDFAKFPEDFTLYELGSWNDKSGEFTGHQSPEPVVRFAVLVNDLNKKRGE